MQLVVSGNRILAHGEGFLAMGGTVINTDTGKAYQNATVVECDGCPSDLDKVGYEYHAGQFVPCAPYGVGDGNIAVVCGEDCKSIKDSGIPSRGYLSDYVKSLFDLKPTAVPNDALEFLGKYNRHWWKRRKSVDYQIPAGYVLREASNPWEYATREYIWIDGKQTQRATATIIYGASVSVSDDGTVTIADAQTITLEALDAKSVSTIGLETVAWDAAGRFFSVKEFGDTVWYGADGCAFSVTACLADWPRNIVEATGVQQVEGYPVFIGVGEWELVWSTDRNAYPDSGAEGIWEYVYQGIPFENAAHLPVNVEVVSYVGTGEVGLGNECYVTFGFVPKMAIMLGYTDDGGALAYLHDVVAPELMSTEFAEGTGFGTSAEDYLGYGKVSADRRTIYWYNETMAARQRNTAGHTYYILGIG